MKGMTKKAAYCAAATLVCVFAFCFFQERSRLLQQSAGSRSRITVFFGLFLFSAIVLGLFLAYEAAKFFWSRAERWRLQVGPPLEPVPELEEAQRLRAAGEPLDAIRLLREYLHANPYELHAMTRLAEIYRYDLKNDLAAALEYEELLKHKLPDDQWAWAALHLAKVYGRLSEFDKSVALLERIDTEYGHTVAGRRAKKALEQVRNPEARTYEAEDSDERQAE
jgi:tetratricopeptide (TPR) repeat protein